MTEPTRKYTERMSITEAIRIPLTEAFHRTHQTDALNRTPPQRRLERLQLAGHLTALTAVLGGQILALTFLATTYGDAGILTAFALITAANAALAWRHIDPLHHRRQQHHEETLQWPTRVRPTTRPQ